ncbi:hypothetical protein GCM10025859_43250 [Alicyclobacillus fastidiosus]|nr:hypothetical protein GCM10025859_43250 [Alicyclobacillus fastidiosus]
MLCFAAVVVVDFDVGEAAASMDAVVFAVAVASDAGPAAVADALAVALAGDLFTAADDDVEFAGVVEAGGLAFVVDPAKDALPPVAAGSGRVRVSGR